MHPREGRSEDERFPALSRRGFIRGAAGTGLLAAGLGPLLEACATGTTTTGGTTAGTKAASMLPRPNNPVTWPIYAGNHAIKSGLQPEKNATLQLYNWTAYVNQQCIKDFEK